jgi:hypothetical protein
MLRRRGNIWVWIIGIPVILGAMAHWGFHYFVKSRVDAFILEAAPSAAIRYDELETSLGGSITLSRVQIVPTGFDQGASVGVILLKGPDVFSYLFGHLPLVGKEGPPDFLDLIMRDLVVDLSGGKAASLDEAFARTNPEVASNRDVCKPGGSASFSQLQELGVEQLRGNTRMGYRHISQSQKLYLDIQGEFMGLQKMSLSLELNNVPALDVRRTMGIALANLKLAYYTSPDFGHRIAEYCGEKRGLAADQYSELLADEILRMISQDGIILGYGLTWALKNYVENWGELSIELSPPRPLGLVSLMNLPRAELPEKLGLQLAINGQLVTDLYFSIHDSAPLPWKSAGKAEKRIIKPRIRYRWDYRKVPLGGISSYLDHKVRVRTADGVVHEGKLVGTGANGISIQKKISGGKFIAHLSPANIRSMQVRIRTKVVPEKSAAQETAAHEDDSQDTQPAAD